MNKQKLKITDAEWTLLNALWRVKRCTASELAELLSDDVGWAYSTVKTILDRMVGKKLVRARKVGNVWEYKPALSQTSAIRTAWTRFVDLAFGGAIQPALHFLATDKAITPAEKKALYELLVQVQDETDSQND